MPDSPGRTSRSAGLVDEKPNVDRIVAKLGLKEMTQGTLIRKLFTPNPTRRAIFEFDKLIRSIDTLRYLRDLSLNETCIVRRTASNPITSYVRPLPRQNVLTCRTDIEIKISNQCARLIVNAIIYYNSTILSRVLTRYGASGNAKSLALITQISPMTWRHILLNGHYTFQIDGKVIDLDAIVAALDLEWRNFLGSRRSTPY